MNNLQYTESQDLDYIIELLVMRDEVEPTPYLFQVFKNEYERIQRLDWVDKDQP